MNESGVSPECNGALTDATERFLRTAAKALDLEIGDVSLRSVQNIEKS